MSPDPHPHLGKGIALALFTVSLAGCAVGGGGPAADEATGPRLPGEPAGLRLELSAEPSSGDAPLLVRFEAQLLGDLPAGQGFDCPTLAWTLDDRDEGQVVLAQAEGCRPGEVARRFSLEHHYREARAYEASLRLIALDLPSSNVVQVLVRGATATAPPRLAAAGPTIVIATPAAPAPSPRPPTRVPPDVTLEASPPPRGLASGTAEESDRADSSDSGDPTEISPTAEGSPPGAAPTAHLARSERGPRVLPADLLFIHREDGRLWRLPADGQGLAPVAGLNEPIESYAYSTGGRLAYVGRGRLWVQAPQALPQDLGPAAAEAPRWARNGLQLAFSDADGGLQIHALRENRTRAAGLEGRPLAWSRDGARLLALAEDGGLILLSSDGAERRSLPIPGVRQAGWLPALDTAWLAGEGLRLLGLEPNFMLSEILPAGVDSSDAFVRADDRLLAILRKGDEAQAMRIDLNAPQPQAEALGPSFRLAPEADLAWSPDGRFLALADATGLQLHDPERGVGLPLLRLPAADPSWLLAPR